VRSLGILGCALAAMALAPGGTGEGERQVVPTAFGRHVVHAPDGRPIVFRYAPRDSAVAAALARATTGFVPEALANRSLPPDSFTVVIAPTEGAFRQATGGRSPDWGLAVAFTGLGRIVVRSPRLTGDTAVDPAVVLRHELAHLWLAVAAGDDGAGIPRWFHEGFAALYADEWRWVDPFRLAWARIGGTLPPLSALADTFPSVPAPTLAYVQSMAAVRSLRERGGDQAVGALLDRMRTEGLSFDGALRETYGMTLAQFYRDWSDELGREYGWLLALGDERALWVAGAVLVFLAWVWRRRRLHREIARRKRIEDAALGKPDDHSLGVEEWDRYWEWDDEEWRGDDDA